jgi:hypothetical protein
MTCPADYAAVGRTTHLAARLEQVRPGAILLPAAFSLRLVAGLVGHSLGPVIGPGEPVEVYALLGASGMRRRVQAATARGLTRFVGRQPELAALHAALAQAEAGHGQFVAVIGEAGVGKSRLLYEFVQVAETQGWLVLDSAAMAYGQATPYFPVLDLLRRYYHLEERDDVRTLQAKVTEQTLRLDAGLRTPLALLALLDALAGTVLLQLAPQRRRTRRALKRVLLMQSGASPLAGSRGLHWLDAETGALLSRRGPPPARLFLRSHRPDYRLG